MNETTTKILATGALLLIMAAGIGVIATKSKKQSDAEYIDSLKIENLRLDNEKKKLELRKLNENHSN